MYIYLANELKRAMISLRSSFKVCLLTVKENPFVRVLFENSIFSAVPRPCTWSFPHNLHLSHPTQSIIVDMLRKWKRNSSFNFWACCPPENMDRSLKCCGNCLEICLIDIFIITHTCNKNAYNSPDNTQ